MTTTALPLRFHEVIRQARRALDPSPTQEDLAARLDVTQPAISSWEKGAAFPVVVTLVALADELHLDVGDLVRLIAAEQRSKLASAS